MKMKTIFSAVVFGMFASVAHAAAFDVNAICPLINELKSVFHILRILAFVGAAFILAATAWDAMITKDWNWADHGKKKLIPMLIGFALLFSVGALLQFLTSGRLGCPGLNTW